MPLKEMCNLVNQLGERSVVSIMAFPDRKVCFVQVCVHLQAMLISTHLRGIRGGDARSDRLLNVIEEADRMARKGTKTKIDFQEHCVRRVANSVSMSMFA